MTIVVARHCDPSQHFVDDQTDRSRPRTCRYMHRLRYAEFEEYACIDSMLMMHVIVIS